MDKFNKIQDCKWNYEKVTVTCPECNKQNIFSRQDDLHTNSTILGLDVNKLSILSYNLPNRWR